MNKTKYFSKKSKGGKKTRRRRSKGGEDSMEDTREDTREDLNKERMVLVGGGLLLFTIAAIFGFSGSSGGHGGTVL